MKKLLFDTLKQFDYPVFLQGSLNADEPYPATFITYFNDDTANLSHYDDKPVSYEWDFAVNFYTNDPALMLTKPEEIRQALRAAGFIPQGKWHDVLSDEPTHTGVGIDILYFEF